MARIDAHISEINPVVNVKSYGAVGNGTADDTAAIQAAIDYAQTLVSLTGFWGAPIVIFPPGGYVITDTLIWKTAQLAGSFPTTGTSLIWNGSAGGTMIERDPGDLVGGTAFNRISNFLMKTGSAVPGTFIDFTTGFNDGEIDKMCQLENVVFQGCSSDAIKIAGWVNCHWRDLRWDGVAGFAIRATPHSSMNFDSFVISRFTYDNSAGGGSLGEGFLMIDNSADASDIGTVKLENARVEMARPWTGNKAFVEIKTPNATRCVNLHLTNIALSGNGSGNSILYSNTANTNITHKLMMTNVQAVNFTNVCGGTWLAALALPAMGSGHWQFLSLPGLGEPAFNIGAVGIYHYGGSPEGVIPAPIGSIYTDTTNGELYVKKTGSGDTGWKIITHAA